MRKRQSYSREFRQEAVQMVLDGHTATSVAERLGLSSTNLLYRWKKEVIGSAGPAARTLGDRVGQLENELRRVERERDILPLDRSTPAFKFYCVSRAFSA
jgi:transposase